MIICSRVKIKNYFTLEILSPTTKKVIFKKLIPNLPKSIIKNPLQKLIESEILSITIENIVENIKDFLTFENKNEIMSYVFCRMVNYERNLGESDFFPDYTDDEEMLGEVLYEYPDLYLSISKDFYNFSTFINCKDPIIKIY